MFQNNEKSKWTKLTFPPLSRDEITSNNQCDHFILGKLDSRDTARFDIIEKCEKENVDFKKKFPELYASLFENVLSYRIWRAPKPVVPVPGGGNGAAAYFAQIPRLIGTVLSISFLHHLITVPLICIIFAVSKVFYNCTGSTALDSSFLMVFYYCGMMVTPIVVVSSMAPMWDETQSWMASYIVWGISSFTISGVSLYAFLNQSGLDTVMNVVLKIIGVDFGDASITSFCGDDLNKNIVAILVLFPSLASLLPAAIAGFIANFILEERFELSCDGIEDNTEDCAVITNDGCCEIISSHDAENMYGFLGGMASSILATWGIIQIFGFLIVSAFPEFALYAKKKK